MNTLVQLKTFCRENSFEFPKFKAFYVGTLVRYAIIWYSLEVYISDLFISEDEAIKSCVLYIHEWLKSEKNYLNLLECEYNSKMKVV